MCPCVSAQLLSPMVGSVEKNPDNTVWLRLTYGETPLGVFTPTMTVSAASRFPPGESEEDEQIETLRPGASGFSCFRALSSPMTPSQCLSAIWLQLES